MKIKKILFGLVIAVVLLLVIALLAIGLSLDRIVKRGVETYGPQITKVTVKVDGVHIGLFNGSAEIKGLAVGNPEGYQAPHSITAGLISVSLDSASVLSDKIVVKSIRLESPEITFEGTGPLKNNLMQLKANLEGTNTVTATPESGPGKKLQVNDFVITGAKVRAVGVETTLTIPEFHLTGLGTGPEGITGQELGRRVLEVLITKALTEMASSGLAKEAEKVAGEAIGKAAKSLTDLIKKKE